MMLEPPTQKACVDTIPLKVLQVASGDLWAGAEKQLYVLALALRQHGIEVSAAIMNPGPLAERLQEAGIPTLLFDESRQHSLDIFQRLRAHFRSVRPDVVHTHRTKENILAGTAAASLGIPSIRTQHGAQEHPASLFDLRRQVLSKTDWLVGRVLQSRVVGVSSLLAQTLAGQFGRSRVMHIPNGLDVPLSPPQRQWGPKPIWHIGIVGRQVPVKRVDIFLRTARLVEQQMPEQGFRFQVIGDGPMLRAHQALAQELRFNNPIEFTGHLENAEAAIANLDLMVICSDHEGLPMVALEAMKAGATLITHRIGALPELIDGPSGGYLAPDHTPEAFAAQIAAALKDPAGRQKRADHAFAQLIQHYSDTAMARAYVQLYASLPRSRAQPREKDG